jgi:hypothetical protein
MPAGPKDRSSLSAERMAHFPFLPPLAIEKILDPAGWYS